MRRAAVVVLCLTQFVDVLGVTSATTAIPVILAGLDADEAAAGPLATTYAMVFGGLLVVGARLGDRYGHRRVLAVGLVAFMAVSLVGGLAGSVPQVLAARALQGAAAAMSVPSACGCCCTSRRGSGSAAPPWRPGAPRGQRPARPGSSSAGCWSTPGAGGPCSGSTRRSGRRS